MATIAEMEDALVNADRAGDTDAARQLANAIVVARQTQEQKPAAVRAGESINSIPRQIGLTARYSMEGLGQVVDIGSEPIRFVTDRVFGKTGNTVPASEMMRRGADWLGLPTPQGANERVVGDAARLVAGGGGISAAGRAGAALPGVAGRIAAQFGASPVQQAVASTGAGLAGGAVREGGGGPGSQFTAALVGGIVAPTAVNAVTRFAQRGATAARTALTPPQIVQQEVDQRIELALRQSGIDWAGVSEGVKQAMRRDVQQALQPGLPLDPAAAARMLQFRLVPGTQPTRGMISQDPIAITREQNLAKVGANSTDIGLQRLPSLQSSNTFALLRNLDDMGAANAPDAFATGQTTIGALQRNVDRSRGVINDLYSQARDTAGRSAQLDGRAFTVRASQLLDDGLLGGALPKSVEDHLNRIARGEVPFDVNYAEQLKTAIGNLQRATSDGQTRMALSVVRRALDETPLVGAVRNPGNLPVPQGFTDGTELGRESIQAFSRARQANRGFMQRVESTPALQAVVDGVEPDRFVQRFITGQGATVADLRALQRAVADDPQTLQAIRQNLVAHLRSAATGQAGDINRFSPNGYNNALNAIGERKLAIFFSPEEIQRLRAVGNVSNYMTAQPAGTAVNNSNSGALMAAKAGELLDSIVGKLPLGMNTLIQGTVRGVQQGQALKAGNALQQLLPPQPAANPLAALLPVVAAGHRPEDR